MGWATRSPGSRLVGRSSSGWSWPTWTWGGRSARSRPRARTTWWATGSWRRRSTRRARPPWRRWCASTVPRTCSTRSTRGSCCRSSRGCGRPGRDYLDMAMSLSHAHPERPYELPGVKLGDEQFAQADGWEADGQLALVGIGVEPGLSDVFARYAADHLFSAIDELGVRDGANLEVRRRRRRADLRAVVLHLDDDRGVPQPAGDLVGGPCRGRCRAGGRLVHRRAVPRAGGVPVPRPDRRRRVRARRARGGAPHAALGRRPEGDVQVRPGRGVHRRAPDAAPLWAWTGRSR